MRLVSVVVLLLVAGLVTWFTLRVGDSSTPANAVTERRIAREDEPTRLAATDEPTRTAGAEHALDETLAVEQRPGSTLTSGVSPAGGIVLEVLDATGRPRGGVRLGVELELWRVLGHEHPEKDQHQEVVTDARGRAPIAASHPSEIQFIAFRRKRGNDLVSSHPFDYAPGTTDVVRLLYPERVVLRGVVRDFSGRVPEIVTRVDLEPVAVAPNADGMHRFRGSSDSTKPDAMGRYELELTPGWYALGASLAGEAAVETLALHVRDEQSALEVDLRVPTSDRRVQISLVSDEPLDPLLAFVGASATPALEARDHTACVVSRRLDELRFSAPHVGNGRWRLELVSGVDYELRAGAPEFATRTVRLPRDVTELTLRLEREIAPETRVLRGRVIGLHDRGAAGIVRLLRTSDYAGIGDSSVKPDGSFEIVLSGAIGTRSLGVLHGVFGDAGFLVCGPIAIDRSREDLELTLGPPLSIRGRIAGSSDPAGATIRARAEVKDFEPCRLASGEDVPGTRPLFQEVQTVGLDGSFGFDGLAAGEYELWVEPARLAQPSARARVRAGTEDVRIELGSGLERDVVFDCTVVDLLTRRPIEGAWVEPRGLDGAGASAQTDAHGRCELRGCITGSWFLAARAPDYANSIERHADYPPGRHAVEIALSPSCALDVELVDSSGAPIAGVELAVTTRQGELVDLLDRSGEWDGWTLTSNIAGRARLAGLPTGPLRLVVGWSTVGATEIELVSTSPRDSTNASDIANSRMLTHFDVELAPGRPVFVRRTLR